LTRHVLYGVRNSGVEETAAALGTELGLTFQDRESDYLGVYKLAAAGSMEIKIVSQPDPAGDPLEDDFVDYRTLVYVETESDLPVLDGLRVASDAVDRLQEDC
jgi:hypothetical protein